MKKNIFFVLVASLIVGLLTFLTVKTTRLDDKVSLLARPARLFTPSIIQSQFEPRPEWQVKISPEHDRFFYVVCQQTLYWLGRGAQAVVFETQDGKYVVKFFQLGRLKEPSERGFVKNLFSKESEGKRNERLSHREEIFLSSKMCYEELQEETGIVYVHLNRTHDRIKGIKLVDKYGQSHRIRGDDASFVVQKKGKLLIPTLTQLMESGKIDEAKGRLNQVFDLLLGMARKNFVDGDDCLIRNNNLGLTEDRAIYIDTGHIFRANNLDVLERMKYEFQIRLEPLENWLKVLYPELSSYYRERHDQIIAQLEQERKKG